MTAQTALWDDRQVAAHLKVARPTLQKWRVQGRGPNFYYLGRSVRYRPEDIDAWVASRSAANTSAPVAAM